MAGSRFEAHTRVERTGESTWSAVLTDAWNIGPVPNGGYQLATMCRAAVDAVGAPDVLNTSCYYLAPTSAGPVTMAVEVIKRGRSSSVAEVRLVQDDRERARALVLLGDLSTAVGPELHLTGPPDLPPLERCVRMTTPPAPVLMNEAEVHLDPRGAAFLQGRTGQAPEHRAWIRLVDQGAPDTVLLTCFADVLPPTTFNTFGMERWVPTLELTVQVRRRPVAGWMRIVVRTHHVSAGHFEEDGELWDASDQLVAVSRQRAMLLPRG